MASRVGWENAFSSSAASLVFARPVMPSLQIGYSIIRMLSGRPEGVKSVSPKGRSRSLSTRTGSPPPASMKSIALGGGDGLHEFEREPRLVLIPARALLGLGRVDGLPMVFAVGGYPGAHTERAPGTGPP